MRSTRVLIVLLAVLTVGLLGSGEAGAHSSSYCGHAASGYLWVTKWTGHTSGMSYPYHYNYYSHYQYLVGSPHHTGMTACPNGA